MSHHSHHNESMSERMKKVRECKGAPELPSKLNSLRFTFSILVEGGTYQKDGRIIAWNGIVPPSKTKFYRYQLIVG